MQKWKRKVAKSVVPAVGLLLLSVGLYTALMLMRNSNGTNMTSLLIRFTYAALLTIGMEYIARYEHEYLWHSNILWYFHASHHHQRVHSLGQGPAESVTHLSREIQTKKDEGVSNLLDSSVIERNDVFAVVFASLAILVLYWGTLSNDNDSPPSAFRDCAVGSATGISLYGTSYFIGHDFCAHERGGKPLASFLRRVSPFMARCADVHIQHHHRVSNTRASNGQDPYGPPYGFWLGESEVKAMHRGRSEDMRMPHLLRCIFYASLLFFVHAACAHFL